MAITYKDVPFGNTIVRMPLLHTVKYADTTDDVLASYQRSYKDCLVDAWLKEHCKSPYYRSPGYIREKFIQFEDDTEAVMFALRWA